MRIYAHDSQKAKGGKPETESGTLNIVGAPKTATSTGSSNASISVKITYLPDNPIGDLKSLMVQIESDYKDSVEIPGTLLQPGASLTVKDKNGTEILKSTPIDAKTTDPLRIWVVPLRYRVKGKPPVVLDAKGNTIDVDAQLDKTIQNDIIPNLKDRLRAMVPVSSGTDQVMVAAAPISFHPFIRDATYNLGGPLYVSRLDTSGAARWRKAATVASMERWKKLIYTDFYNYIQEEWKKSPAASKPDFRGKDYFMLVVPSIEGQTKETFLGKIQAVFGVGDLDNNHNVFGLLGEPGNFLDKPDQKSWIDYLGSEGIHECGHAHKIWHTPDCGAQGGDGKFPYADETVGVPGWEPANSTGPRKPASTTKDLMTYCDVRWISDYNYKQWFDYEQTKKTSSFVAPEVMKVSPDSNPNPGPLILSIANNDGIDIQADVEGSETPLDVRVEGDGALVNAPSLRMAQVLGGGSSCRYSYRLKAIDWPKGQWQLGVSVKDKANNSGKNVTSLIIQIAP